jgi:hypothetical protein
MMTPFYTSQCPAIAFQLFNQLSTVHSEYYNANTEKVSPAESR